MRKNLFLAIALAALHTAYAADGDVTAGASAASAPASAPTASTVAAVPSSIPNADFCLYPGSPPSDVKYRNLGRVKLGKGTYGSVRDELPSFVGEALAKGADAVTNYNGAQRFGFWPWRMVRPVLTGIAVKFDAGQAPPCEASGGTRLATVMATNIEPARH